MNVAIAVDTTEKVELESNKNENSVSLEAAKKLAVDENAELKIKTPALEELPQEKIDGQDKDKNKGKNDQKKDEKENDEDDEKVCCFNPACAENQRQAARQAKKTGQPEEHDEFASMVNAVYRSNMMFDFRKFKPDDGWFQGNHGGGCC